MIAKLTQRVECASDKLGNDGYKVHFIVARPRENESTHTHVYSRKFTKKDTAVNAMKTIIHLIGEEQYSLKDTHLRIDMGGSLTLLKHEFKSEDEAMHFIDVCRDYYLTYA